MTQLTPSLSFQKNFRRELLVDKKLIGCGSLLANAINPNISGLANFDWMLLSSKQSQNDVENFKSSTGNESKFLRNLFYLPNLWIELSKLLGAKVCVPPGTG